MIYHHLLSHGKEGVWSMHHCFHFLLHLLLDEQGLSIGKFLWIRAHASRLEVRGHLAWNFGQHFLRQSIGVVSQVSIWDELHNIST